MRVLLCSREVVLSGWVNACMEGTDWNTWTVKELRQLLHVL